MHIREYDRAMRSDRADGLGSVSASQYGQKSYHSEGWGHDRPTINQDMDLVFDMAKIHFFDKDTDNTIV